MADKVFVTRATLEEMLYESMVKAACVLPRDVREAIERCLAEETDVRARGPLQDWLNNDKEGREKGFPLCEPGWPLYWVMIGDDVEIEGGLSAVYSLAKMAVASATEDGYLRAGLVHPLTRHNPGNNVGDGIPGVELRFGNSSNVLEVVATPKGGGAEIFGSFYRMLVTGDKQQGVIKYILDCYLTSVYAGLTCPPNIIGVGIGGTAEICVRLAKEACVLRPIGSRNPDPGVAQLESDLLEQIDKLGVGPMGIGGNHGALAVHIECALAHTASLPVAYNAQCVIARRAVARYGPSGQIEYDDVPNWPRL